jgi:hypothetical protein
MLDTTSNFDLEDLAKRLGIKNFKIFSPDLIKGKIPANQVGIVNLDDSSGGGTHWVAFYQNKSSEYAIYYDSYGIAPDPRLLRYLKGSGKPVIGQTVDHQHLRSKACGYFCIYFLYCMSVKGMSFSEFLSQFDHDEKANEKLLEKFFKPLLK